MLRADRASSTESWWDEPLALGTRRRLLVVGAAAIFIGCFLAAYQFAVSPLHSYIGYFWSPPPAEYTWLAAVLAWLPSFVVPLEFEKPSDFAVSLFYPTFAVPAAFLPFHVLKSPPEEMLPIVLAAQLSYWTLIMVWRAPSFALRPPQIPMRYVLGVLLILTVLFSILVAGANGFRINLSFADIYERRLAARESVSGAVGYAMALLASSLSPLCVAIGLERKRPFYIVLGMVGIVAIFSFTGTKSSIFTPLFMLCMYWLYRRKRNQQATFLAGLAALVAIGAALWLTMSVMTLNNLLNYRLVSSRGVAMAHYWKVFEGNQIYMGDSAFAPAFGIAPAPPKSFTVGSQYGYSEQDNYNAGIWAAGYANFGVIGMVLASLAAGATLKLMDAFARVGYRLTCFLMAGLLAIFWSDIGFENSLISQGLVMTLPFLYFLVAASESKPEVASA